MISTQSSDIRISAENQLNINLNENLSINLNENLSKIRIKSTISKHMITLSKTRILSHQKYRVNREILILFKG